MPGIAESSAETDLLTTGEAARLLGTSRQHVVDLCAAGRLPYLMVGTHRRVSRRDVEELQRRPRGLSREQQRSLWLHHAIAGKLVLDPSGILRRARRNLTRLRMVHPKGRVQARFEQWQVLLEGPPDVLLDVLVSRSSLAVELRQNSPFAGVLTESERAKALRAFYDVARVAS